MNFKNGINVNVFILAPPTTSKNNYKVLLNVYTVFLLQSLFHCRTKLPTYNYLNIHCSNSYIQIMRTPKIFAQIRRVQLCRYISTLHIITESFCRANSKAFLQVFWVIWGRLVRSPPQIDSGFIPIPFALKRLRITLLVR